MSRLSARSPANWRAYDSANLWLALLLALVLILMWMFGRGPNAAGCCAGSVATAPPPSAVAVAAASAGLAWSADGKLTLSGAVKDEATKKSLLDAAISTYGAANVVDQLTVNPGAASSKVVLTGSVASEAEKASRGAWAASVFGPAVAIDNQLQVVTPAATVALVGTAPPAVNVYFATGKTDIDAKDRDAIATMLTYLKANPGVKAIISGYHDPRGDKAMNEELAKNRAKSVRDVLIASGVNPAQADMRKPVESTGSGDNAEARRVELRVE
jgi:outer membrane protein OmpA-like peptidoglycan-associated protein